MEMETVQEAINYDCIHQLIDQLYLQECFCTAYHRHCNIYSDLRKMQLFNSQGNRGKHYLYHCPLRFVKQSSLHSTTSRPKYDNKEFTSSLQKLKKIMAKLASSIVAAILFVAICYQSITAFAQSTSNTGNCLNSVDVSRAHQSIAGMQGVHVEGEEVYCVEHCRVL